MVYHGETMQDLTIQHTEPIDRLERVARLKTTY